MNDAQQDEEFARRLHMDLNDQSSGVIVVDDDEDLKYAQKLQEVSSLHSHNSS